MKAHALILIRPRHFGYNAETAGSNLFQQDVSIANPAHKAVAEFDALAEALRHAGVTAKIFEDRDEPLPDAVFLNNWFSTHADGTVIVYPMLSPQRRGERREDLLEWLQHNHEVKQVIDLSDRERLGQFLEGTGSLVFDHCQKMIYAALSPRTSAVLVRDVARVLGYGHCCFCTHEDIYHTNVMMNVCDEFAVLCSGCMADKKDEVMQRLGQNGREVIDIRPEQMAAFAGNMLCVKNSSSQNILLLSQRAYESFSESQAERLAQFAKLLPVAVPVIETIGGGSVRCMLAENFLVPKGKA